jgi:hypothetical protein
MICYFPKKCGSGGILLGGDVAADEFEVAEADLGFAGGGEDEMHIRPERD